MAALLHSKSRFFQKTLVQYKKVCIHFFHCLAVFFVPDGKTSQLLQSFGEGQKNKRRKNIEHTVDHCDTCRTCRLRHK